MSLVPISAAPPAPHADARLVAAAALRDELVRSIEGEVRFDKVSRALYSTDASVYQIEPFGPRRTEVARGHHSHCEHLPQVPLPADHARWRHIARRSGDRRGPSG